MARESRFVILMTEEEKKAIEELASIERLPATTWARRILLLEAQQRGVVIPQMQVFQRRQEK